jgi:hypothetical protein
MSNRMISVRNLALAASRVGPLVNSDSHDAEPPRLGRDVSSGSARGTRLLGFMTLLSLLAACGSSTTTGDPQGTGGSGATTAGQGGTGGSGGSGPCVVGDFQCVGDDLFYCSEDGSGFVKVVTCPVSGLCDAETGQCDACAPNSAVCKSEIELSVCSPDGQEVTDTPCSGATPYCAAGADGDACVECLSAADCLEFATECAAAACTATGTCGIAPLQSGTPCGPLGEGGTCNGSGQCVFCDPGDTKCDGSVPATCDGAGQWVDGNACNGAAPICSDGACVECVTALECPETTNDCLASLCDQNVCGFAPKPASAPCANGAGTCNGSGQCNFCSPTSKVCNGNALLVCGSGGAYDPPINCGGGTPYCDPNDPRCVQCYVSSQCAPSSNPCLAPNCAANVCGFSQVPNGSACTVAGENGTCNAGQCAVCTNGATRCKAGSTNTPQLCVNGQWADQTACSGGMPNCVNGACSACSLDVAFRSAATSAGATSYWTMDETGSNFVDVLGGRNGLAGGNFQKGQPGLLNGGLSSQFAAQGFVSVASSTAFSTPSFSLAAWTTFDGMMGSTRDVVQLGNGWELRYGGVENAQFALSPNVLLGTPTQVVLSTKTYFVVGTYDAGAATARFYVDGSLVGTKTGVSYTPPAGGQVLNIGRRSSNENLYRGKIDNVVYFPKSLSGAEVLSLFGASCQ